MGAFNTTFKSQKYESKLVPFISLLDTMETETEKYLN